MINWSQRMIGHLRTGTQIPVRGNSSLVFADGPEIDGAMMGGGRSTMGHKLPFLRNKR